ncbi:MAG: hypothetical protein ABSF26_21075 [Thermoguttaceae bacterium]|jgi:hypothetical protein
MPTYEVEQYELHAITYRVEADSAADAIVKLFDGAAEPVAGSLVFIETPNDYGLPAEDGEYQELAEALSQRGVSVGDCIPSIRDIREIKT